MKMLLIVHGGPRAELTIARAVLDAVGHCSRECVPGERIHAALMPVEAMV